MSQEVAKVILSQLGGSAKLQAMLGASSFASGPKSLSFKIAAKAKNKIKAIIIELNGRDLYDIRFVAIRGFECVDFAKLHDVDCEQLKPIIEAKLGLALSF